ncbi:MAG: hypothetical protein LBJ08_02515, partial [Bifidobacteriaceae bacterium]|nr:hypothetical protein [Bifidobacteriaceae bacterium]
MEAPRTRSVPDVPGTALRAEPRRDVEAGLRPGRAPARTSGAFTWVGVGLTLGLALAATGTGVLTRGAAAWAESSDAALGADLRSAGASPAGRAGHPKSAAVASAAVNPPAARTADPAAEPQASPGARIIPTTGLTSTPAANPTAEPQASPGVRIIPTTGLTLTPAADTAGLGVAPAPGDHIGIAVTLTNTGTATLTGIEWQPSAGLAAHAWPGTPGVLAPSQSVTVEGRHTVTQVEIESGHAAYTTVAFAKGARPDRSIDDEVAAVAHLDIPLVRVTRLALAIGVEKATLAAKLDAGDRVGMVYRVANVGNAPITGVAVSDRLLPDAPVLAFPSTPGSLAPGQSAHARGTYRLTQHDLDAGQLRHTANARGEPPGGDPQDADDDVASAAASEVVRLEQHPNLTLTATSAVDPRNAGKRASTGGQDGPVGSVGQGTGDGPVGQGTATGPYSPVGQGTRDSPVGQGTATGPDSPVGQGTRDSPVGQGTPDGPVGQGTPDGPVGQGTP